MNQIKSAQNPILRGFKPDPSICAVDNDYYIAVSSFAYFPGVPIYHSRNLRDWTLTGHALTTVSQLPLDGANVSRGIFAPTLRYHDGTFYMITTNVDNGGNFLVTAKDPKGPWSDPVYLKNAPGIDPSLFFDEDGKCYYTGNRPNPEGVRYNGDWEIWCQELCLKKMELTGDPKKLWKGALSGAIWPEGPHLYKKDGFYYLLIAEGGTGDDHCITIARSVSVFGPYEGNPKNPIITHRHLGKDYPVKNVGHGDLFKTASGEWMLIMLASRTLKGKTYLGRETFLARVKWEEGWPVVNPGVGKLTDEVEIDLPAQDDMKQAESSDKFMIDFNECEPGVSDVSFLMSKGFVTLNRWSEDNIRHKEFIQLRYGASALSDRESKSFLAKALEAMEFSFLAEFQIPDLKLNQESGITIFQNHDNYLTFGIRQREEGAYAEVVQKKKGISEILYETQTEGTCIELAISCLEGKAGFSLSASKEQNEYEKTHGNFCVGGIDMSFLSTEEAGGFVGCMTGAYATGNGTDSNDFARLIRWEFRGF